VKEQLPKIRKESQEAKEEFEARIIKENEIHYKLRSENVI